MVDQQRRRALANPGYAPAQPTRQQELVISNDVIFMIASAVYELVMPKLLERLDRTDERIELAHGEIWTVKQIVNDRGAISTGELKMLIAESIHISMAGAPQALPDHSPTNDRTVELLQQNLQATRELARDNGRMQGFIIGLQKQIDMLAQKSTLSGNTPETTPGQPLKQPLDKSASQAYYTTKKSGVKKV